MKRMARRRTTSVDFFEVPPAHSGLLGRKIKTTSASIYGIGHLGSWAARVLVALGIIDITVHDFDDVEERNISGSIYGFDSVSDTKANALRETLHDKIRAPPEFITGRRIQSLGYAVKFQDCTFPYQAFSDFYILATDSAETRYKIAKTIFKHWDLCGHVEIFANMKPVLIDMRSAGGLMTMVTIPILDKEMRARYLQDLVELAAEPGEIACNEANIPQVPFFEAAIVAQTITSILRGVEKYYCYNGSLLDLTTYPIRIPTDEYLPKVEA
jgi:molybdopterin/thiamine biosynthesis adenylyltransferase